MSQPYIGLTTESEPIYYVDDITDYDGSEADTSSSIVTDSTMSTLESVEARSRLFSVMPVSAQILIA
jgi:hypothetical protein